MCRRILIALFLFLILTAFNAADNSAELLISEGFKRAEQLYGDMLKEQHDYHSYPRTANVDGSLKSTNLKDWTSGFWAGNLWYVYEYTHGEQWKNAASEWTNTLADNQDNKSTHDLGFMMYCSYGNGYRLTHNPAYKNVLIQSAKSLTSRYSPVTKCIKSWDQKLSWDGKTMWHYPVIIDNMMNLELLFWATKATGDSTYYKIAVTHAQTTMKNHIRPDYSTYHVVNYDEKTGKILSRETNQGYADNSTWARGQAWAIYGFTMVYRETRDIRFLKTAQHLADFFLNNKNLPEDKIPLWDFYVNQPGYQPLWAYDREKYSNPVPRDASAAAIVSSALFELSSFSKGEQGVHYKNAAVQMLTSLSTSVYLATPRTNDNFLIKHAVGSLPHHVEIDVPLVYADYYYLEALLRYKQIER